MKISLPELDSLPLDEAEKHYKRANLEARKLVEDKATFVSTTVWACLGGVGGIIGGSYGVAGASIGAVVGVLAGSAIGSIYKSRVLKAATRDMLQRQLAQLDAPSNGLRPPLS